MNTICVYCGSTPGRRPEYTAAAHALAQELLKRDIALVYGGASVGVMGAIADAVVAGGGDVIGVIPRSLLEKEVAHSELSELIIADSMHERKTIMAERADGFIALPGGLGTIEELFEVLTWAQLGFHKKPCGLLNVMNFYDQLSAFLDHAAAEQFIKDVHRNMLLIECDPEALLDKMTAYSPPTVDKWIAAGGT